MRILAKRRLGLLLGYGALGEHGGFERLAPLGFAGAEVDGVREICFTDYDVGDASKAGGHLGAGLLAQVGVWLRTDDEN